MKKKVNILLLVSVFTLSSLNTGDVLSVLAKDNPRVAAHKENEEKPNKNVKPVSTAKYPETEQPKESETETETETEIATETETEIVTETETESGTERHTTPDTETEQVDTQEGETEAPQSENSTETEQPQTEHETETDTQVDTEPETEPQTDPSEETETETETDTDTDTEIETEEETELKDPELITEAETETEKTTETENAADNYENIAGEPIYILGSYPSANITEVTNLIYDYLVQELELNHAAAAGVLANIQCESNFYTLAVGDSGTSFGLCQWHLERFAALINHCGLNGKDFHMLDGQLSYLKYELTHGYAGVLDYLKSVPNTEQGAYNAGYYWCMHFENPNHTEYNSQLRGDLARHEYFTRNLGSEKKIIRKVIKKEKSLAEIMVTQAPQELKSLGIAEAYDIAFVDDIIKTIEDKLDKPAKHRKNKKNKQKK